MRVTGTLGVLRAGAEQGLVNVPAVLEQIKSTSFYLDDALLNVVFERWLKR
jgi:predicted nucleic acid-binding protein